MDRLHPRQLRITQYGQRHTTPRVLHARPSQRRIEVITTVHEHRARLNLIRQSHRGIRVFRPNRCGQTKITVVHQTHRLIIARHRHDANHRTETFFRHHAHAVIHINQNLRRKISRTDRIMGKLPRRNQSFCPRSHRIGDLLTHKISGTRTHHRAQIGVRIHRIAKTISFGQLNKLRHKIIVQTGVHINSFHPAARLP